MATESSVWRYGSAIVKSTVENDICHTTVSGVITPSVALQILRDNRLWLTSTRVAGQVTDYSRTALVFTSESLEHHCQSAIEAYRELFAVPCALVVRVDQIEMFGGYSSAMAQHGIFRAPFLGHESATGWVARQAAALDSLRSALPAGSRSEAERTTAPSRRRAAQHRKPAPALAPPWRD